LDGANKMSKSLGNYIGIDEPPSEIFGKLMSISDVLMWRYFELLSFRSAADIARLRGDVGGGRNPRDVKIELAKELVARFHDAAAAAAAHEEFEARFQRGVLPDDMPEVTIASEGGVCLLVQALKQAGLTASTSEALRMIQQGAVRLDGEKVVSKETVLPAGARVVVQVGKRRFGRLEIK
jgi:tyrosyl-tRNA synthetase